MLMQKLIHRMVKTATPPTNLHPTVMKLCKSYVLLLRICFQKSKFFLVQNCEFVYSQSQEWNF